MSSMVMVPLLALFWSFHSCNNVSFSSDPGSGVTHLLEHRLQGCMSVTLIVTEILTVRRTLKNEPCSSS